MYNSNDLAFRISLIFHKLGNHLYLMVRGNVQPCTPMSRRPGQYIYQLDDVQFPCSNGPLVRSGAFHLFVYLP